MDAVLSVVFPGVEPYLPEFLSSLSKQTDGDFKLFLINDGMQGLEGFLKNTGLKPHVQERKGLATQIRKHGIAWVVAQGAQTIMFADADDYFAPNRMAVAKTMLKDYDLVSNELLLVGQGISQPMPMLGAFFDDQAQIKVEHITTGNCLGLSNTAVRASILSAHAALIPDETVAFDWALFAPCIHNGAKAVFTKETQTYYRQHQNNLASPQQFSQEQIMRGVEVKKNHYQWMSRFYKEYVPLAKSFENLLRQLKEDQQLRQRYCHAVKQHASALPLWWKPIKSVEELGL